MPQTVHVYPNNEITITINADYVPPDPQAAWWIPELTTASEAPNVPWICIGRWPD